MKPIDNMNKSSIVYICIAIVSILLQSISENDSIMRRCMRRIQLMLSP